ncbi:hypothetical protein B0T24DRAFT_639964 [Lasiosphaeria ovina]|uniref:GPI anchored protein n=1 Tax=Lasiosphaeria ovina TaxID=92902 RepID=A0AAE0JWH6_9PEZI|nr:hypothetical protein B0T24DRAFT_639964 [Lasiosphaeria ovina]
MLDKLLPLALLFSLPLPQAVQAQSGSISVGPLLTCSITTFGCPSGGCCTIDGCCAGGCCANGYTCINEATNPACCPVGDATKCGTVSAPSPGSGTGTGSGSHTCTGIDNCPRDPTVGRGWTCLLGKTCGFSFGECNPCPYIAGGGSGTGSSSDDGSSSGSGSPTSSSGVSDTTPPPTTSSGAVAASTSTSTKSSFGLRSTDARACLPWLAALGVGVVCLL